MAKTYYMCSLKGGTGVTTVCVGLGLALAEAGEKTLYLDGDAYGGCGLTVAGLGNMQVYTLADYEKGACRAKQAAIRHPKCQNFFIMPCLGLNDAACADGALEEIGGLFDYILADKIMPKRTDGAAIVSEPYLPSVKSADRCRSLLTDGGIKDVSLILNKVNGGQILNGEIFSAEKIAEALRLKLLAQIPEDNTLSTGRWKGGTVAAFKAAAQALISGKPNTYDVLSAYSGFSGYIKRKLRARL